MMLTCDEHFRQREARGYSNRDMTMAKLKILCFGATPEQSNTNLHELRAVHALGFAGILEQLEVGAVSYRELAKETER